MHGFLDMLVPDSMLSNLPRGVTAALDCRCSHSGLGASSAKRPRPLQADRTVEAASPRQNDKARKSAFLCDLRISRSLVDCR